MPDQHTLLLLLIVVVVVALAFDFLNGFHDAANAIATIVVTRTLTPGQAVILAGAANFFGYCTITLGFGTAIMKTVGKGVVDLQHPGVAGSHDQLVILLSALLGAVLWNIITWLLGLPTSSSHALIGGLAGSMIAAVGFGGLGMDKLVVFGQTFHMLGIFKVMLFIIIAPLLGLLGAAFFTILIMWICKPLRPAKTNAAFKKLQIISATWYSFGHGMNDAQKTMAIIMMALIAYDKTKYSLATPEHWVVLSCYAAIGLGTMFGGWRIVKTMGTKITKIRAMEGFCAESAAGLVLMATAQWGVPVSTTHVIAGSIMGVGTVEQAAKVRWVTARNIIWAWILTIPLTAICTALVYLALHAALT